MWEVKGTLTFRSNESPADTPRNCQCHVAFQERFLDCRTLRHGLKSFSTAFLWNPEHQFVQDPGDVLFHEFWNLKWRLRAHLTSLGKDAHLHLARGFPLTQVHVEKGLHVDRGPTARAPGAREPVEAENEALSLTEPWAVPEGMLQRHGWIGVLDQRGKK